MPHEALPSRWRWPMTETTIRVLIADDHELVREGIRRELEEETGLIADVGDVVWVASNFHDPAKLTVGIWFAGSVTGGTLQAGDDADEAAFFHLDDLPPLAFSTNFAYFTSLGANPEPPDSVLG